MDTPKPHRLTRNLAHLSIAPLSSLHDTNNYLTSPDNETSGQWTPHASYISGRSAPTTPGILSRNPSSARLTSAKSLSHLTFTNDTFGGGGSGGLAKSKSTTLLLPPGHPGVQNHGTGRRRKLHSLGPAAAAQIPVKSLARPDDDGEWLFRAGALISNEARESKGQSWLTSRESSTSLVAMDDDDDQDSFRYGASRRHDSRVFSAHASRNASRAASTRTSRRPSGVGSSSELSFFTPTSRTPARDVTGSAHSDYFGDMARNSSATMGPDFVDEQDEEEDEEDIDVELRQRLEEAEVARLAQDRGFGLGGLVDRLMEWTLFDVKEDEIYDAEDKEEQESLQAREQELRKTKSVPAREQTAHIAQDELPGGGKSDAPEKGRGGADEEEEHEQGGWKDAAWLLSVASKVLL